MLYLINMQISLIFFHVIAHDKDFFFSFKSIYCLPTIIDIYPQVTGSNFPPSIVVELKKQYSNCLELFKFHFNS